MNATRAHYQSGSGIVTLSDCTQDNTSIVPRRLVFAKHRETVESPSPGGALSAFAPDSHVDQSIHDKLTHGTAVLYTSWHKPYGPDRGVYVDGSCVCEEHLAIVSAAGKDGHVSPGRSHLQKRIGLLLQYLGDRRNSSEVASFGVGSSCTFVL